MVTPQNFVLRSTTEAEHTVKAMNHASVREVVGADRVAVGTESFGELRSVILELLPHGARMRPERKTALSVSLGQQAKLDELAVLWKGDPNGDWKVNPDGCRIVELRDDGKVAVVEMQHFCIVTIVSLATLSALSLLFCCKPLHFNNCCNRTTYSASPAVVDPPQSADEG
eukprot:COSAG01_NODE_36054_length_523_cov_0.464623_1_plen_169_part_10